MKQSIKNLIATTLDDLTEKGLLPAAEVSINIDRTKQKAHGDFASNIALMLAKPAGKPPREVAQMIVDHLPASEVVTQVEIAGPGFINFFVKEDAHTQIIPTVLAKKANFGRNVVAQRLKYNLEFVSANPTGPLHVGHGRGAAYGSAVANLLKFAGHHIETEYYVNDAGRQMDILAVSIWLRYLERCGEIITFPKNGYQGAYVTDIAQALYRQHGAQFQYPVSEVFLNVPADEGERGGDKEAHIDGLIGNAKSLLREQYDTVHGFGLDDVLAGIKQDLKAFHVEFDRWFSEKRLHTQGEIDQVLTLLNKKGLLYEKGGARWFKSSELGDEKDRVLVRENGQPTYFAADAAYLLDKVNRGYDRLVYVWGADHHGYVPRLRALASALDIDQDKIDIPLVQFAVLYRGGKQVQMSTRSGSFVTLKELYEDVSVDAARYFYIMRKCEQHLDFDLDLAKSKSNENPVYYIQYAHARICSVLRQLKEQGGQLDLEQGMSQLSLLVTEHELSLMKILERFPEMIASCAQRQEPHVLAYYLKELAQGLHSYYNSEQFLVSDENLKQARLALIVAVRQVLQNGLTILGLSAPEVM